MSDQTSREGRAYGRSAATLQRETRRSRPGHAMRGAHAPVLAPDCGLRAVARPAPRVRVLGEDLVLFRDARGVPGLLYPRCMHRGTSLYYGRIEAEGIRCCYHGWLFDTQGRCLDQPCEPDGGRHRDNARQPWYPVQERYGLVFAYLGTSGEAAGVCRSTIISRISTPEETMWVSVGGFGSTGDRVPSRRALQLAAHE